MDNEILMPEAHSRKKLALIVVLATIAGAAALMTIEHSLGSASNLTPEETSAVLGSLGSILKVIAVGMVGLLLVLATTIVRVSIGTLRSGRFPPPGVQVVRATKVLNGSLARRKAVLGFVLAGLVVATGVVGALTLWQIATSLTAI